MSRERILVFLFAIYFVFSTAMWTLSVHEKREDALHYKNEFLQTQVKYEQTRGERDALQAEVEDLQKRLAAAAERERAAKVRASRSRSARGAISTVQRTRTYSSNAMVHDVTMYCPTGSRTASGKWPTVGMVATISRSIPFGTRVVIDGLGIYTVEDRIGHGSEFDIFTESCAEADRFGRQHRHVTILN